VQSHNVLLVTLVLSAYFAVWKIWRSDIAFTEACRRHFYPTLRRIRTLLRIFLLTEKTSPYVSQGIAP
jgi:hypothetical protein